MERVEDVKIGLEVHIPITSVETKLFCSCRNTSRYRPSKPNQYVCPVCLGLPGALPRPNEKAVYMALKTAKALRCRLTHILQFYRKHYFYPDLPKGYQITQFKAGGYAPLGEDGVLMLQGGKAIGIRRVQIEEDPAKLIHPGGLGESDRVLIDYNRSGNPLIEIVTEPDLSSPREAREFLDKLIRILTDIGVLDKKIDVVIRADANISIGGSARIEIKNIGSPKDVEKALEFEKLRLERYVKEGIKTVQETRHWDDRRRVTVSIREKEVEEEYRYFPDPNIPPINIKYLIEEIKREEILLEDDMYLYLIELGVRSNYAEVISRDKELYDTFNRVIKRLGISGDKGFIDKSAGLFVNEGKRLVKETGLSYEKLGELIYSILLMVKEGLLTFEESREKLLQKRVHKPIIGDRDLEAIINEVITRTEILGGEAKNYIIGEVLRKVGEKGFRVDPKKVAEIVDSRIGEIAKTKEVVEVKEEVYMPVEYRESIARRKISISDAFLLREGEYILTGWIESKMDLGRKLFIILRDWSGRIQLVVNRQNENYEFIRKLPREAFIKVEGSLHEDRRAPDGVEVHVNNIQLLSEIHSPPLSLLDLARSSIPIRLKYRYLDIRRRYMRSILSFRSKLLQAIREYLIKDGFVEINTPKIITTATEGGAELFPFIYYGREAFLAQSPQLYKQMAINAFEKVFEIDSYYRAQKYDTPRHLAEFWSIDIEVALYTLDDLLKLIEDLIINVSKRVRVLAKEELKVLDKKIPRLSKPFKRITYSKAVEIIRDRGVKIRFGEDFGADHLKVLGKKFRKPFFIIYWPSNIRAFYYKRLPENPKLTLSFDLIYPLKSSYPLELSSGGERINTVEELRRSIREKGLREESYTWYLEMFKYGMPPHAGFGLGLDRLVMALLQLDTILDTVLSPRTPRYSRP